MVSPHLSIQMIQGAKYSGFMISFTFWKISETIWWTLILFYLMVQWLRKNSISLIFWKKLGVEIMIIPPAFTFRKTTSKYKVLTGRIWLNVSMSFLKGMAIFVYGVSSFKDFWLISNHASNRLRWNFYFCKSAVITSFEKSFGHLTTLFVSLKPYKYFETKNNSPLLSKDFFLIWHFK